MPETAYGYQLLGCLAARPSLCGDPENVHTVREWHQPHGLTAEAQPNLGSAAQSDPQTSFLMHARQTPDQLGFAMKQQPEVLRSGF